VGTVAETSENLNREAAGYKEEILKKSKPETRK
jgi:hypothetical protein